MFVPPPPKVVPPMPVVAPYVSDADQRKKLWKLGMQHHLRALEGVTKVTDQSDPGAADAGVRKAREKARDFQKHETRRDIDAGNRHLVHRLKEIVQKPSVMSKASDGATRHSGTRREMLQRDRQLRQKNIEAENHSLVRRLLAVKSSLDSQSFEKDYRRHRQDVGRLQQLPEKNSKPRKLPKLPEKVLPELPKEEYSPKSSCTGYRPARQALPLPPRMSESRSMPSLSTEAPPAEVARRRAKPEKPQESESEPPRLAESKNPRAQLEEKTAPVAAAEPSEARHGKAEVKAESCQAFDCEQDAAAADAVGEELAADSQPSAPPREGDAVLGPGENQHELAQAADDLVSQLTADALASLEFSDAKSFLSDTMRSWSTMHISSDIEAFCD
ncbi:hypothetical protein AK812_SmicGene21515 [Symbiodinium microadriaticum]|uniref:Uncharacterized protein n=1 Tax=Symbiodinium microadriaticum TaxID=2951 RepID=A0A1Q9DM73_SYMMI|nr:hypothetical protein AK812_SmicGene21515 [Symbiodinium microadriaticum]CAE7891566.1 unnamed protein product [Symbiodinium microadriaticum]CAE7938206.1 unnamed protein product [Symbiodinium sp. KB8]